MTDLILSLQITALGMGLVFGAILLLWLMMVILTALTADKDASSDEDASRFASPAVDSVSETGYKLQAAAIAVAVALAEQELSSAHPLPEPPTAIVSAWQLGMRTSQRSEKGNFRRH